MGFWGGLLVGITIGAIVFPFVGIYMADVWGKDK